MSKKKDKKESKKWLKKLLIFNIKLNMHAKVFCREITLKMQKCACVLESEVVVNNASNNNGVVSDKSTCICVNTCICLTINICTYMGVYMCLRPQKHTKTACKRKLT